MNCINILFLLASLFSFQNKSQVKRGAEGNHTQRFKRCDKIIFKDSVNEIGSGVLNSNWELIDQQLATQTFNNELWNANDEKFTMMKPLLGNENYLTDDFSIEFDLKDVTGSSLIIYFDWKLTGTKSSSHFLSGDSVASGFHELIISSSTVAYTYPDGRSLHTLAFNRINSEWSHIELSFRAQQMRVYRDSDRNDSDLIFTVNNCDVSPHNFLFAKLEYENQPVLFKNVIVAVNEVNPEMQKIITEGKITTHSIQFDPDSSVLKPEALPFIDDLATFLQRNPRVKLEINAFTDSDGDFLYNIRLSNKRADAIKARLVCHGVAASRVSTKGFGEIHPVASNTTKEGKAQNRRVEFVLIK